jgi:hypothetical protein
MVDFISNFWEDNKDGIIKLGLNLVTAIIIYLVGSRLVIWISQGIARTLRRANRIDKTLIGKLCI